MCCGWMRSGSQERSSFALIIRASDIRGGDGDGLGREQSPAERVRTWDGDRLEPSVLGLKPTENLEKKRFWRRKTVSHIASDGERGMMRMGKNRPARSRPLGS